MPSAFGGAERIYSERKRIAGQRWCGLYSGAYWRYNDNARPAEGTRGGKMMLMKATSPPVCFEMYNKKLHIPYIPGYGALALFIIKFPIF